MMKTTIRTINLALSILAGVVHVATLQAATWTNGNWSVAANWAEGAVPAAGSAVTISPSAAGMILTVDVDSVSVGSLAFGGSAFTLEGGSITSGGGLTANAAATVGNNLNFTANSAVMTFNSRCELLGDVTSAGNMRLGGGSSAGGANFRGAVSAGGQIQINVSNWQNPPFRFYGPVTATAIGYSIYQNSPVYLHSNANAINTVYEGYCAVHPWCAGALPANCVVSLVNTSYATSPMLNLHNFDQAIDRITTGDPKRNLSGQSAAAMTYSLRSYLTSASDAAPTTLKLNATTSNQNMVRVYDKITLIYNPQGNFTQTFSTNFAHTTSGDIIVSNGTFRVAGTSTFANVKRIVVADGATFNLATEASDALAGVTNIVVGAGARFAIAATAATPFTSQAVSLELDDGATFELPAGADWLFGKATVGGRLLDGGTYPGADAGGSVPQLTGTGQLTLPGVEMPTVAATWDGGGADDSIATAANWDDDATPALVAGSLYPLFATGGEQALADRALDFKGLHFGGASASFSIVSNSPSAALTLRQSGIAVDASHTATLDIPATLKSDETWSIGAGSTLRFKQGVGMANDFSVAVSGAGATTGSVASEQLTSVLRLDAPNGFLGPVSVAGTLVEVYSPTNAFGPQSDSPLSLSGSMLRLRGTVIDRPVTITGQNNKYYWFASYSGGDGTNRITGALTQSGFNFWRPRVQDSVLVNEDGVTVSLQAFVGGGGTWIIRGKPWKHSNLGNDSYLDISGGTRMRFGAAGCAIRELRINGGEVHCDIDNPFGGYATRVQLSSATSGISLNGHEATFGSLIGMAGGYVTSSEPALLRLSAQNAAITNKAVRFIGAAGISMGGSGKLVFTNAMESSGPVAVESGTLEFTGTGSWAAATNVRAMGTGRLKVASPKTFAKTVELELFGDGVLEIPSGVTLRASRLKVGDAVVTHGEYGAAGSGANTRFAEHFAGGGTVLVGDPRFILMLR